jgi:hypothetical protein
MVIVRNTSFHSLSRIAIVLLLSVAWFALSNHCVLGAACASASAVAKGCPMHMKSSQDSPTKHRGSTGEVACCKTLRAVTMAKIGVATNTLNFALKEFFPSGRLVEIMQSPRPLLALDTGPPRALSFSESVLQRSIRAHAPPHFA